MCVRVQLGAGEYDLSGQTSAIIAADTDFDIELRESSKGGVSRIIGSATCALDCVLLLEQLDREADGAIVDNDDSPDVKKGRPSLLSRTSTSVLSTNKSASTLNLGEASLVPKVLVSLTNLTLNDKGAALPEGAATDPKKRSKGTVEYVIIEVDMLQTEKVPTTTEVAKVAKGTKAAKQ